MSHIKLHSKVACLKYQEILSIVVPGHEESVNKILKYQIPGHKIVKYQIPGHKAQKLNTKYQIATSTDCQVVFNHSFSIEIS